MTDEPKGLTEAQLELDRAALKGDEEDCESLYPLVKWFTTLRARDATIAELRAEVERLERQNANQVKTYHILDDANKQRHIELYEKEKETARLEAELRRRDTARDLEMDAAVRMFEKAERERDEAHSILATTADRLNTALRESGCGEMLGDPYRSLAIRDGIVSLYDRGARWRVDVNAHAETIRELRGLCVDSRELLIEQAGRGGSMRSGSDDYRKYYDEMSEMDARLRAAAAPAESVRQLDETDRLIDGGTLTDNPAATADSEGGIVGFNREETDAIHIEQLKAELRDAKDARDAQFALEKEWMQTIGDALDDVSTLEKQKEVLCADYDETIRELRALLRDRTVGYGTLNLHQQQAIDDLIRAAAAPADSEGEG